MVYVTTKCKSHVLLAANLQLTPSLRRREKLAGKVGRREIYPPVPPPPGPVNKDTFYGLFSVRINGVDSVADPGH